MSRYSHSRKAGNAGDVFKHLVLVEVVRYLLANKAATHSKDFTFGYLETHAGAPEHVLHEDGEWKNGIGKLINRYIGNGEVVNTDLPYLSYTLDKAYKDNVYPSSWSLIRELIHTTPVGSASFTLFDTSAEVAQAIKPVVFADPRIRFEPKDGFKHFKDNTLYRTDFVLVDPDYKDPKDWVSAQKTAEYLLNKEIPFLLWYPIFGDAKSKKLVKTLNQPTLELKHHDGDSLPGSGLVLGGIENSFVESLQNRIEDVLSTVGVLSRVN